MTAHCCQGATISGLAALHVEDCFSPGQAFVMLSRVTNRKNLKLLTPLLAKHFVPVVLPKVSSIHGWTHLTNLVETCHTLCVL